MNHMFNIARVRLRVCPSAALLLGFFLPNSGIGAQDTTLTLRDAIQLAVRQNVSAASARHRVEQTEAQLDQARAGFFPLISASAGNRQRTFNTAELGIAFPGGPGMQPLFDPRGEVLGPINIYDARVRVTQSIFLPSLNAHIAAMRFSRDAMAAQAAVQEEVAASLAADAYVRLARAQDYLAARVADSVLASELLTIARDQLQVGTGIALDVTRAEANLSGIRAEVISLRVAQHRASIELARVTGLPVDMNIGAVDSLGRWLDEPQDISQQNAITQARAQRAELRALETEGRAAEQQASAVRAERWPSISAFADDGVIGRGVGDLRHTYNWGVQLSVPLLDLRRRARVDEIAAQMRSVDTRLRDAEQRVRADVRIALLELQAAHEHHAAALDRIRLSTQELQLTTDRFRAGITGNAEVISASLALNAARRSQVDARAAVAMAHLALAKATGRLVRP